MHGRRRQRRRRTPTATTRREHGGGLQLLVLDGRAELSDLQDPGRDSHLALAGQLVSAVPGVITAVRPNSLYIQDAVGDGNHATSDAIVVFRKGVGAGFPVGQAVLVSGRVTEFRPGGGRART